MESVYKGYPIGTLLFWEPTEEVYATRGSELIQLPGVPSRHDDQPAKPATYVLDGVQRLSSLYNCLRWKALDKPHKFNIVFDVESKTFTHFKQDKTGHRHVHLSSIFYPTITTQLSLELESASHSEGFLEAVTRLRARFIDYEVTIMTLTGYEWNEAISIFRRLNNSGLRLTREEIRRAEAERDQ